jgi:hypothetical protein
MQPIEADEIADELKLYYPYGKAWPGDGTAHQSLHGRNEVDFTDNQPTNPCCKSYSCALNAEHN